MTKKIAVLQQRNSIVFALSLAGAALSLALILPFQASAAMITQQLDLGETNADVSTLQSYLSGDSSIYPEGIVSGYYGSLTAAAVARFQTANGLPSVGRVGPMTRDLINTKMGNGGGTVSNGFDVSSPIMSNKTLSLGTNGATIAWQTNESANSRVMYGTSYPFLYATAPSFSANGFNTSPSVTLNNLQSRTTYYYILESIDGSGNITYTTVDNFTTN